MKTLKNIGVALLVTLIGIAAIYLIIWVIVAIGHLIGHTAHPLRYGVTILIAALVFTCTFLELQSKN
jgi:hypothetical protein